MKNTPRHSKKAKPYLHRWQVVFALLACLIGTVSAFALWANYLKDKIILPSKITIQGDKNCKNIVAQGSNVNINTKGDIICPE